VDLGFFMNLLFYFIRHWFSMMGTVLPFEIITYAI
jgi:hypothetical protein